MSMHHSSTTTLEELKLRLTKLGDDAIATVESINAPALRFWQSRNSTLPTDVSIEAHCDIVYSLSMSDRIDTLSFEAARRFAGLINSCNLPGFKADRKGETVSVHNFAYALGALNIFGTRKTELYNIALSGKKSNLSALVDPKTKRPVFPLEWSHHNWRVSHWIGGIPSILLSMSQSGCEFKQEFADAFGPLREATDALIVPKTGLLKAYRSELLQSLFRKLYAVRHDPELGDVGGIAHLLWIDHVVKRPYVGLSALYEKSTELFNRHVPFMEHVPYCLDFDIVQLVRTAGEQLGRLDHENVGRARQMMVDIEEFFAGGVPEAYTLHKIPGALATYHECGLLVTKKANVNSVGYVDIIEKANWL